MRGPVCGKEWVALHRFDIGVDGVDDLTVQIKENAPSRRRFSL